MIRNFFKNLFSTTATRGRLEYLGAMVALMAVAAVFASFALAATTPFVTYASLLIAIILQTGLWFVVAQRVRDIGWSVPLVMIALIVSSALSTIAGVGEDGAVVVVGGPWALVNMAILFLIALVPGKSHPVVEPQKVNA